MSVIDTIIKNIENAAEASVTYQLLVQGERSMPEKYLRQVLIGEEYYYKDIGDRIVLLVDSLGRDSKIGENDLRIATGYDPKNGQIFYKDVESRFFRVVDLSK